MYLPHSVPLARPHVAIWFGRSGKRYDFAVCRARPIWLGQPVVYVLVRYDGDRPVPLFAGRATASDPQLGGAGSEAIGAWEQAMALGMTHLHLRFEACSEQDRAAEVEDLIAALRPALNEPDAARPEIEEFAAPAAPVAVLGESIADFAPMSIEAKAPLAALPQAATARPDARGGWLGRTAAAFAGRYRGWRWRPVAAARTAVPAEAASGRVTVRADAVVVDDAQDVTVAAAAVEAHAAGEAQAVVPTAMMAEPAANHGGEPFGQDPRARVRERLGLSGDDVVVLVAGALDWASGADLAVEAMATVHADPAAVRLVLVGDGPLRSELEGRVHAGGFSHACRFLGDLPAEAFAEVFAACDAVAIPARSGQNPMLAEHGLSAGKPVLTTHPAGLGCVRHGENGLVAYDNPGSLVWGLRELGAMVRRARAPAAALAA